MPSPLLTVNQSSSASFQCNATGIPIPVARWFRGSQELVPVSFGESLNLSSRIIINDSVYDDYSTPDGNVNLVESILTITPTLGSDSGTYSCNVSNVVGTSQLLAEDGEFTELFVQGKSNLLWALFPNRHFLLVFSQ